MGMFRLKKVILPTRNKKIAPKNNWRDGARKIGTRKPRPTPVKLDAIHTPPAMPTLCFTRKTPKCTYMVPPLSQPCYWFDQKMVDRGLIIAIPPHHFVVDGRRFRVLAQDWKVIGVGYTRWLVVEEHKLIPKV